jgi:hypothetical protein
MHHIVAAQDSVMGQLDELVCLIYQAHLIHTRDMIIRFWNLVCETLHSWCTALSCFYYFTLLSSMYFGTNVISSLICVVYGRFTIWIVTLCGLKKHSRLITNTHYDLSDEYQNCYLGKGRRYYVNVE